MAILNYARIFQLMATTVTTVATIFAIILIALVCCSSESQRVPLDPSDELMEKLESQNAERDMLEQLLLNPRLENIRKRTYLLTVLKRVLSSDLLSNEINRNYNLNHNDEYALDDDRLRAEQVQLIWDKAFTLQLLKQRLVEWELWNEEIERMELQLAHFLEVKPSMPKAMAEFDNMISHLKMRLTQAAHWNGTPEQLNHILDNLVKEEIVNKTSRCVPRKYEQLV